MKIFRIISFGIAGAIISGLLTFNLSIRTDNAFVSCCIFLMFLVSPALSCVLGGLRDYKIASMIVVYTLIGVFFFGAMRPVVAIAPSRREVYRAEEQLRGDIGPYREVIGGCVLAIGRIVFIRKKRPKT